MSILSEIQKWAATLPLWQQDAIRRLYAKSPADAQDIADLYALLKVAHGIPDPLERHPIPLSPEQVAPAQTPGVLIQLAAIKNLQGVNAIAEGQTLSVSPTGLTIIYGANGAGKSGYARVLKRACRARDKKEPILSNAHNAEDSPGKARATFDVVVDGVTREVTWAEELAAPSELASLAVFDAHCARAYIDSEGDFSYSPYGFDILLGLAGVCTRLKDLLVAEENATVPVTAAFGHLCNPSSSVGQLLLGLSADTKPTAIELKATLSPEEIQTHTLLAKALQVADPKAKAAQLKLLAARLKDLAERCTMKGAIVSETQAVKLKDLIAASNEAKKVAELAAKQFKETPGQVPGTGGDAWMALFEAARLFSIEAYPDRNFPDLGGESPCPLCQQPLGAAAERLLAFDAFIQKEAEKVARTRKAVAQEAYIGLVGADLQLGLDVHLAAELRASSETCCVRVETYQKDILARQSAIKAACKTEDGWHGLAAAPLDPAADIYVLIKTIIEEAAALEKVAVERQKIQAQFQELDDRVKLAAVKPAVLAAIETMVLKQRLGKCNGALKTNGISVKVTELNEKVVTQELETALNKEFVALGVADLQVRLRSTTEKGKTSYKLVLHLPGEHRPARVLSEGEQRTVAIASFLADMNLAGGAGGIIFDDPVSSLDHRHREQVAKRLVQEATKRQVIILTHDLYFLCLLQQAPGAAAAGVRPLSLRKTKSGFGVPSDDLPFDGLVTTKRVGALRIMQQGCAALAKSGDEDESAAAVQRTYVRLRSAWERAIEEVLLGDVVTRFRAGVSTVPLIGIEVSDDDYLLIDEHMSRCSKYAHDGAAEANVPTPSPQELLADIDALEVWRKATVDRREAVRARRKLLS